MKLSLSKNQMMIATALVIVAILFFYMKGGNNKGDLVYFFSPNCPHCRDFMPIWDNISTPSGVGKKKVNCDNQACPGIEALPTIMLNGEQFNGERTKENIETFINKNI